MQLTRLHMPGQILGSGEALVTLMASQHCGGVARWTSPRPLVVRKGSTTRDGTCLKSTEDLLEFTREIEVTSEAGDRRVVALHWSAQNSGCASPETELKRKRWGSSDASLLSASCPPTSTDVHLVQHVARRLLLPSQYDAPWSAIRQKKSCQRAEDAAATSNIIPSVAHTQRSRKISFLTLRLALWLGKISSSLCTYCDKLAA